MNTTALLIALIDLPINKIIIRITELIEQLLNMNFMIFVEANIFNIVYYAFIVYLLIFLFKITIS
ncbi:MAG: hypothetical protein PWQ25_1849 [Deferribacteres bacterium]|jgi:hypothetical protein|nr:hypothetical protein [Deferribacteres bacterium]